MVQYVELKWDGKKLAMAYGFNSIEDLMTFINSVGGATLKKYGYHLELVKDKQPAPDSKVTIQ